MDPIIPNSKFLIPNYMPPPLAIYVDADACPSKHEILTVCKRHLLCPIFVANAPIASIVASASVRMEVVTGDFDAADNWIVEQAAEGDLVLTADLLLAQRVVKKKADVMNFSGNHWTDDVIHDLVAGREIQKYLREMNLPSRQAIPYNKENRSRLKASLHQWIEARLRR